MCVFISYNYGIKKAEFLARTLKSVRYVTQRLLKFCFVGIIDFESC